MDATVFGADILSDQRADQKPAVCACVECSSLKSELHEVKSEILNNTAAIRSEVDAMKTTI